MNETARNTRVVLRRRIRRFYDQLNRRAFNQCYVMIDPRILDRPEAITIAQYKIALGRSVERAGSVNIQELRILSLHLSEPTEL